MAKCFNVTGLCVPDKHYMVSLEERLAAVRKMIEEGWLGKKGAAEK